MNSMLHVFRLVYTLMPVKVQGLQPYKHAQGQLTTMHLVISYE